MARIRWSYLTLYYALALAVSLPFNTAIIYKWLPWHVVFSVEVRAWLFVPAALGPALAGLLCYRLDRATPRRIGLLGPDRWASVGVALVPIVTFTVAGALRAGTHGWSVALIEGSVALLYALGEEVGWRGYLQDALRPLEANRRYLFVGLLWWAWHGRFSNFFEWTVFALIVIASAFGLGRVAEKTRSLLFVASLHSVIMLLTMNGSDNFTLSAGALTILVWVLISRFRPTPTPIEEEEK